MPFADINNIKMYYEIAGDKKDIPLILVPGLRGDSISFATIAPRLKRNSTVITVDNRGSGRTVSDAEPLSTELMAADIIALMNLLDIPKANFLGHSMGGFIVQKLAACYSERVNKLILSCCSTCVTEQSKKLLLDLSQKQTLGMIAERDFNEQILKFYSAPIIYENDFMREAMLDFMEGYPYKQSVENFKKQVNACISHNSLNDLLKIKADTLVIAGELDSVASLTDIQKMTDRIDNSKLIVIKNAGHLPFAEDSKAYVGFVANFLFNKCTINRETRS